MSRARILLVLVITAAFILPVLQLGFLQSWREGVRQASPNNGTTASFFVLHARPYYVVPEDFHLYVVRAKRIAERGWSGDLLWGRDGTQAPAPAVKSAPLQVGLGYLAYLTGGEPLRYTLFLMGILAFSWSALALIALRELRAFHGFAAVLAFSLLVAICEVPTNLLPLIAGYIPEISPGSADKIWPAYKVLRFATHSWSLPLFVGLAVIAARLVLSVEYRRWSIGALAGIMVLFALGDVWSLILSLGVAGLSGLLRASLHLKRALHHGVRLQTAVKQGLLDPIILSLGAACLLALGIFLLFPGPSGPDVVARSGFGSWWLGSEGRIGGPFDITVGRLVIVTSLFSVVTAAAVYVRNHRTTVVAALIGALPLMTAWAMSGLFWIVGADGWQTNQFHDRAYATVFLSLLLQLWVLARYALVFKAPSLAVMKRRLRDASTVIIALLAAFFVLHAGRTYIYIERVAAHDYALTEQLESLKATLQKLDETHHGASFATMSHEINYLTALWTDFDLVLPEGFPLHFSGSNEAIAKRMAGLLHFYKATPDVWNNFDLRTTPNDQYDWLKSRALSAREGFSYYLFHRQDAYGARGEGYGGTVALIDQELADLQGRPQVFRPDIVVLDEVSALLGRPDLDDYMRVSGHAGIEVWVRTP